MKRYFLSVIFKSSLGNSNWFAFTIIIFYFYSYISFLFTRHKLFFGIIIISFLCLLHTLFVYFYYYPKAIYSVDTVLCFIGGFYYSFSKNYIDKVLLKNDLVLITLKARFNNDLLNFLNSHSYSIYLFQRLVIWIVSGKQIFKNYNFIQISFEFTSIFFIASLFDKYTTFIDKIFKKNSIRLIKFI